MYDVLNFDSLLKSGIIPSDARMLNPKSLKSKCIPLSRAKSMQTLNSVSVSNVVADKAVWACYSKRLGLYSCDGDKIYRFDNVTGEFITYILRDRLVPIKNENLKLMEELGMSNNVADALEALKKNTNLGGAAMTAPLSKSDVFEGDLEKEKKKKENQAKREGILKTLSSEIGNVNIANTRALKAYNYEKATIIGWLTSRDKKVRSFVKTEKIKDQQTKKYVLKEGTPSNIAQDYANSVDIDPKHFATKSKLLFKQDAPGPIKVAVLRFPLKGLVPIEELRNPSADIKINPTEHTDYVINYVNKNDLPFFVNAYIGKSIKEDPRTHTDPSKLMVITTVKTVTNAETNLTEQVKKTSMKIESKKPLIQEKNYFPQVTYHTIPLSEAMSTEEGRKTANISLFENLFSSNNSRARSWDKLNTEDKEKVSKGENGEIVSKFLDPKVSLPLNLKDFYSDLELSNPEIAIKVAVEKKDGSGVRYVLDKYDVVKGGDSDINPLTSGRFTDFIEACQGTLTQEKLAELLGRKSTGGSSRTSTTIELDDEQALKLFFKQSEEGLTQISGNEKEFGAGRVEEIQSEIFSLLARTSN